MKTLLINAVVAALVLFLPVLVLGEDGEVVPSVEQTIEGDFQEQEHAKEELVEESEVFTFDYEDPFVSLYEEMKESVTKESIFDLEQAVAKAELLRQKKGIKNLSEYSRALIYAGGQEADEEKRERFYEIATQLSPTHPFIRYEVERNQQGQPSWEELVRLGSEFWSYPSLLIPFLSSLVYPIMLSLTFGLLLVGVSVLIGSPTKVLRPLARFGIEAALPKQFVVIVLPSVVLAIYLGPLACLAYFAVLLAPVNRFYLFSSGIVILLWGIVIPLHENIAGWENNGHTQSVFRLLEGDHGPGATRRVFEMHEQRPDDLLALAAVLHSYLYEQDYDSAMRVLGRIEELSGVSAWTTRNKGVLHYVVKDFEQADIELEESFDFDDSNAETLFWLSKVKFELLKTEESRELFLQARDQDAERLRELEKEEADLQSGVTWIGETFDPPSSFYIESAREELPLTVNRSTKKVSALFYPLNALLLCVLGFSLLVSPLVPSKRNRAQMKSAPGEGVEPRRLLTLIPGGLLASSRLSFASFPFAVALFLGLFLALGWPAECGRFFALFPELAPVVLFFLFLFVLIGYPLGWIVKKVEGAR